MSANLIDGHVSVQQCKRAVDALLAHATKHEQEKAETQLLPGKEQNVWLVVNTKVMHPEKKLKPARISVKYPIVDPRTTPVCLITKDPQREYKDLIAAQGIKFISRVVDIRHLKGKWKPFEARRMLLNENGMFLADERVVPLLPALLGKIFFKAKKQPISVCITRKDLKGELERAISSTYFHQNQGTCASIKVGAVSQTHAQVLANLQTALPEVVKHVKGGWDNIQSFFIKTNHSAALPIWQCDLGADAGGRWDGLVAKLSEDEDAEMDDEESGSEDDEEMVPQSEPEPVKDKGKKRAAEEAEDKPMKKAKAAAPIAVAQPTPSTSEPSARKRRKSKSEPAPPPTAAPPAAVPTTENATTPAKKEKRKRARASLAAAADSSAAPSASVAPAEPVTPSVSKKHKGRASAIDFFDDNATPAAAAVSAVPPNTPADGLAAETPAKRKKRSKGAVADTPVSTAIAKLAAQPEADTGAVGTLETPSGKKKRRSKKTSETEASAAVVAEVAPKATKVQESEIVPEVVEGAPVEKKKKRKQKQQESAAETDKPVAAAVPTLTPEERKRKRSGTGGEKKKEKVVGSKPAAKSAKDEVLGKKSKKL